MVPGIPPTPVHTVPVAKKGYHVRYSIQNFASKVTKFMRHKWFRHLRESYTPIFLLALTAAIIMAMIFSGW